MTTVLATEVAAALATSSSVGEYFRLDSGPRTGEWLRLDAWCEPEVLQARIAVTEAAITGMVARRAGTVAPRLAPRVAASTVSLGIFARLLAPPLGSLVLSGVLPDLTLTSLWWQPVLGGAVPLACDPAPGRRPGPDAAAAYDDVVLTRLVVPLLAAFRRAGVSPVVLLGNVASALGGAARMIDTARPDSGARAWQLVGDLLERPVLGGAATVEGRSLRRHSCCLFYRVPGGGYCGDCILRDPVGRRRSPTAARRQPG